MFAGIIQFLPPLGDKGNFVESKDPLSPVVRRKEYMYHTNFLFPDFWRSISPELPVSTGHNLNL